MKIFRILFLLLLAYGVFVVFTFPASFATTRLNAALPQVQVKGVDGTIWSGGAKEIHYQGMPIGALEWQAQPLGVLQGEWKNHLVLNGIVATTRLNAALPQVQVKGVDGTIWSGGAKEIHYQGMPIGALEWQAQPLGVLQGEWKNHLVLNGIVDGEGELAYGVDGEVNLYDMMLKTTFSKLIGTLDKRIPAQLKQFQGEMQAEIVKLAVEPQSKQLTWLEGEFFLNNLQISDGHYLGDFAAEVTTIEPQKFRTVVRSTSDGGLQLQGVIIATQQGDIELDLRLAKVELLGKHAARLIKRFMKKSDDGYYRFQWQGNVKYLMMLVG